MWNQILNSKNEEFREMWVHQTLSALRTDASQKLLDVGAGLQPYKVHSVSLGYQYVSHDFSSYAPQIVKAEGLQNSSWEYPQADINCDILEIPETTKYDLIVCTEVLEHVPDPASAFKKMTNLLAPEGALVISVPMMSLMHQAPYWFQSGLSPQWFEYHSKSNRLKIEGLTVYGDYVDYMEQEILRIFEFLNRIHGLSRIIPSVKKSLRNKLNPSLLESAGFGVVYIGRK
jgi:2-polyprenyl-3-methyl-5-hydroxy-6-metoxy-1,4-benzoquinol methylase